MRKIRMRKREGLCAAYGWCLLPLVVFGMKVKAFASPRTLKRATASSSFASSTPQDFHCAALFRKSLQSRQEFSSRDLHQRFASLLFDKDLKDHIDREKSGKEGWRVFANAFEKAKNNILDEHDTEKLDYLASQYGKDDASLVGSLKHLLKRLSQLFVPLFEIGRTLFEMIQLTVGASMVGSEKERQDTAPDDVSLAGKIKSGILRRSTAVHQSPSIADLEQQPTEKKAGTADPARDDAREHVRRERIWTREKQIEEKGSSLGSVVEAEASQEVTFTEAIPCGGHLGRNSNVHGLIDAEFY